MSGPTKPSTGNGRTIGIVIVVVILVAVVGFYFLSGMGSGPSTTSTGASPSTSKIAIAGGTGSNNALNFNPPSIKVVIGVNNTISWQNNDSVAHTITFTSAPSGVSTSTLTDSNLAAGGSYSVTLTTAGTYQYHCTIHSWMTGTITVVAA